MPKSLRSKLNCIIFEVSQTNIYTMNYKCRFHLGAGEHFLHWRIENVKTKEVKFYNPQQFSFTFLGCFLRNQKATARKINNGANKEVCAWIECDSVIVTPLLDLPLEWIVENCTQVCYNPKITPNWQINGVNADSMKFEKLVTFGSKVFFKGLKIILFFLQKLCKKKILVSLGSSDFLL